jgi:type III restriction enzyme
MASAERLANPILNSPYFPPEAHFELGPSGPTGEVLPGRRPSESFVPVPVQRKGTGKVAEQVQMDFDVTGERRETNTLINDIRREVERWRASDWNGVTPYSRKLLAHWAPGSHRDDPVLFCQREAAETAIFLAEVAGRHGTADYRRRLEPENALHNDGLPRIGLKMATGTGKTVVMAMLIAWQTINKVFTPKDARFAKRFLVVTPGITIRDRLGVLHPEREDNYYRERDLVPPDLWEALLQAQVEIVNYHTFLPRDAKEIQGVASNTRKLLRGHKPDLADAFQETPDMVAARVLRGFGTGKGEIVVLNDEAHHCYQDKLLEHPDDDANKEDEDRNRDARVWFRGLVNVHRKAGIKAVYDLSATPYYLKGSGYNEGFIFPWVVSDFSLMDAIESGIVKVPRIPVDDDAAGSQVVYLNLWDNIQPPLPKRRSEKKVDHGPQGWIPPDTLEGALRSLYRSYEAKHEEYEATLAAQGEPPPVLIVVCPNTVVSKLVFDWITGREVKLEDGTTRLASGNLPLLSNVEEGAWTSRQRTILVDSAQLESGDPLGGDFRKDAAQEIEVFKRAYHLRNPGADVDKLTDADLLREAMNTIGKKGKLGEHIRCVVSVAMLTEGWDATPCPTSSASAPSAASSCASRSWAVDFDVVATHRTKKGASSPSTPRSTAFRLPLSPATSRFPSPRPRGRRSRSERRTTAGISPSASPNWTGIASSSQTSPCSPISTTTRRCTSTSRSWPSGWRIRGSSARPSRWISTTSGTPVRSASPSRSPRPSSSARSSSPRTPASSARGCSRSWSTYAGAGWTPALRPTLA